MKTILEQILEKKRVELEVARGRRSIDDLKRIIADRDRPRNFFAAVTNITTTNTPKRVNLIAEIKKASPSAGVIRADFNPVELALSYASAGADALSVLTDESFFQGHLDYIEAVRTRVSLPVLRKDFIIDPYQVYETRAAGADAILLIADCLKTHELIDLQILATELQLTCLIEVHGMDDLIRVRDNVIGFPHRSYSLLGINNRDLNTFKTDLGTTLRMAELIEDKEVLISESGIRTRHDIDKLADAGVRAVLIGETFMRQPDPGAAVAELFRK